MGDRRGREAWRSDPRAARGCRARERQRGACRARKEGAAPAVVSVWESRLLLALGPSGLGCLVAGEGRGQRRGRAFPFPRCPARALVAHLPAGKTGPDESPAACLCSLGAEVRVFSLSCLFLPCVTVNVFLPRSVCPRILRSELLYLKIDKILFLSVRCHQRPTSFN